MAEVIQFPFGGKKKKEQPKSRGEAVLVGKEDSSASSQNHELASRLNYQKLGLLLRKVTALMRQRDAQGAKNILTTAAYLSNRSIVSGYDDEEIISLINDFDESLVASKLTFFVALIEVAKSRGIITKKTEG